MFFIAAGVHVVTGLIFDILGSGEIQKWNSHEDFKHVKVVDELKKKALRKISASLAV